MAKQKLRKYELIYLVQPEATDEERDRIASRVQQVFESFESKVLKNEDWGKRKLAYEIQKHNKAFYTYIIYVTKPGTTIEVERVLRVMDNCVRFLHIKLEEGLDPDGDFTIEEPTPRVRTAPVRPFDDDDDDDADEVTDA